MKNNSTSSTHDLQLVNHHITTFVDKHERTVLPLPFLSSRLTSETFFTSLVDSKHFSEEECNHPDLKNFSFVGELVLCTESENSFNKRIDNIRNELCIAPVHLESYFQMEEHLKRMPIANIVHFSNIELLFFEKNISATTLFGDPHYAEFCRIDPIFLKYNYIGKFLWQNQNHQSILKKRIFNQAVPL